LEHHDRWRHPRLRGGGQRNWWKTSGQAFVRWWRCWIAEQTGE
jgi:hypothetical protein